MPYCTIEDLLKQLDEAALIELTDDAGSGEVGEEVAAAAIADADAEIDAHAGLAHAVPLDPVPPLIRRLSVDLALHNLYARRGGVVPESRERRHERALALLSRIAEGKIALGDADPDGNPPEKAGIEVAGEPQVMTPGKLARY